MIECNPAINFGMPALKGRRLTVYNIVTKLFYEDSLALALSDYEIAHSDAVEAVNYCTSLTCKEDTTLIQFCDGCYLRTIVDRENNEDYDEPGSVAWLIAEEVKRRYFNGSKLK